MISIHELPPLLIEKLQIYWKQLLVKEEKIKKLKIRAEILAGEIGLKSILAGQNLAADRSNLAEIWIRIHDLSESRVAKFRAIFRASVQLHEAGDLPSAWRVARAMDFKFINTLALMSKKTNPPLYEKLWAESRRAYKCRGRIAFGLQVNQIVYDNKKLILDNYGTRVIPRLGNHLPNFVPNTKRYSILD